MRIRQKICIFVQFLSVPGFFPKTLIHLQIAAKFSNKKYPIQLRWGFWNKINFIHATKEAAYLPAFKQSKIFFKPQSLKACRFAASKTTKIQFLSHGCWVGYYFFKNEGDILRCVMFSLSTPILPHKMGNSIKQQSGMIILTQISFKTFFWSF